MNCGLLGRKLSHSYSPCIHSFLGDYHYKLYEVEPDDLGDFLQNNNFHGLNVTIPYKKSVIPFCAQLSPIAQKLGAVNTIVRDQNGSLVGHNTDYFGFTKMVEHSRLSLKNKTALVLGSGGASATVCAVLNELNCETIVISRNGKYNYENAKGLTDTAIIVNATPVGMYPNNQDSPIDLSFFPRLEGVFDLIYNPARTKLLQQAADRHLTTENGLLMLVAQAAESASWFLNKPISADLIEHIHKRLMCEMENIILIGMPGSGKSTIGQILAAKTGRTFIDSDEEIVKMSGKTIPEIFVQSGEQVFRNLETKALEEVTKRSSHVIATGGGCVTQPQNYPLLHQNGRIIWIKRNIDQLPVEGRPLSQSTQMSKLYQIRKSMYEMFADYIVENNGSLEDAVSQIMNLEEYQ